jgi:hypothetical protein
MFHNLYFHFREPEVPDDGNTRQPGKSYRIIPDSGVAFVAACEIRRLAFVLVPSIALAKKGQWEFAGCRDERFRKEIAPAKRCDIFQT